MPRKRFDEHEPAFAGYLTLYATALSVLIGEPTVLDVDDDVEALPRCVGLFASAQAMSDAACVYHGHGGLTGPKGYRAFVELLTSSVPQVHE